MLNLPDLNVTGFESKAYIRYYAVVGLLLFMGCFFLSCINDNGPHSITGGPHFLNIHLNVAGGVLVMFCTGKQSY